jgi:hypothetical protein
MSQVTTQISHAIEYSSGTGIQLAAWTLHHYFQTVHR